MLRKIIDILGYVGLAALFGGYFYYSLNNQWDWKAQASIYGGAVVLLIYLGANLPRIRAGLTSRTGRYGSAAGAAVLLTVAILVLINFLNFRHHRRFDLTEQKLHSLAAQSQKVVENLETPVRIIGFFQDAEGGRSFQDLMTEYRYASSKIEYEVVDPQKDPAKVSQYEIQRNGQVVVNSGSRTEIVEDFTEEKITNAVIKVTRKGEKYVYFLQGHGERDLTDREAEGFSLVQEAIEKQNYKVAPYNLAQENTIPENATVMISGGPKVNFFPNEVDLLKRHLAQGGKFFLLVDPQTDFSMGDFLGEYGLSLDDNVVIDASGIGQLFGLGGGTPLVAEYASHPITQEMGRIMTFFPMARGISTTTSSLGYETQKLLSTSERSWGETRLAGQSVRFDEGEDKEGPLELAVLAVLSMDSNEEEPEGIGSEGEKDGSAGEQVLAPGGAGEESGREARFVLFGDSDFATNGYFNQAANGDLFLNVVSWLAEDTDLVAVRPKNPENRRVNLTMRESKLIFWGTVIFLPLATLILGMSVWFRRR